MFNKTFRSVLSLALVLCMVLGLCGNALAVDIPGGAAVTNRFNSVIEQLETAIDNLEAQIEEHEKTLNEGESKLEDGKLKLEEGKQKLAELKKLLADAENAIEEEGGYRDQLEAAQAEWDRLNNLWTEADKALTDAKDLLDQKKDELGLSELEAAMDAAWVAVEAAYVARDEAIAALGGAALLAQIEALYAQIALVEDERLAKMAELYPELMAQQDALMIAAQAADTLLYQKQDEAYNATASLRAERDALVEELQAEMSDPWNAWYHPDVLAIEDEINDLYNEIVGNAAQEQTEAWNAYFEARNAVTETPEWLAYEEEINALYDQIAELNMQYNDLYNRPEIAPYDEAIQAAEENAWAADAAYYDAYYLVVDELTELENEYWEKESELWNARVELDDAQIQLDNANAQMEQALLLIADAKEAIEAVEDEMVEAEGIIAEAEAILADAKPAMEQANKTIAAARALIDGLKKTYADLLAAIDSPEANTAFVEELIVTMQADMTALWNAVLELQKALPELLDAYAALEGKTLVYDGFEYHHEAVRYEMPNGDVYEYPAVNVVIEGFNYSMPELPAAAEKLADVLDAVIARTVTAYETARYYWLLAKDKLGLDIDISMETLQLMTPRNVYDWLYNNPDVVCGMVKEFGLYALELLANYGPYAEDFLENHSDVVMDVLKVLGGAAYLGFEYIYAHSAGVMGFTGKAIDFVMQYKDQVMEVVRELYNKYGDEIKALAKVYADYLDLEERLFDATHADITIFHDSLYVAIGDGTAAGGYVEKLAELMEIPHMTENLAANDMSVGDAIELVGQKADLIAKADLITLGFSNLTADKDLITALQGGHTTDWTGAVGEKVTNAIRNGLDALRERLMADGYDVESVDELVKAASAYAFAYAARAMQYPELVKTIRDINPNAQIVIVGAYNELEGVVLTVAGHDVNIGKYTELLIRAANLENLMQAIHCDNVNYVSAFDVQTVFEENATELNNLGHLLSILNDEMLPTEAGHAYIAEQIFNALNIEYKIWGDVNGDRRVNCRDVRLLMRYVAELVTEEELDLTLADVNGDGRVNVRDVRTLMLYCAELIEHFPVCDLSEE